MRPTALTALAVAASVAVASPALAHIRLDEPEHRYSDQKDGPCGAAEDERTNRIAVYEPGETITVRWEETIEHPSHFRIAFSLRGTEDFEDPDAFDDFYTNDAVLADDIPDQDGDPHYEHEVTLPDEPCETCTLQLIQVMYDVEPYGPDSLYWQCADIALRSGSYGGDAGPGDGDAGASLPSGDAGAGGSGPIVEPEPDSGCRVAEKGPLGGAALVAIAALVAMRRFEALTLSGRRGPA